MPLKGVKVLEFAGLAPGPMCGKILADFGAKVTVIDKVVDNPLNCLSLGKRILAIDLKKAEGQKLVSRLVKTQDVLIEPFRPGVMEKMQLGPEVLCKENPRLIYARLTGFGQKGRLAKRAGHDINYIAISGVLSMLGGRKTKPLPPINMLADFAGGSLMCALGICLALLERHRSGRGQIVDAAMIDGAAYVASWLFMSRTIPGLWEGERGTNLLDGGSYFYDTYQTKDGKYMSVGPLEPQFFDIFKSKLGLPNLNQYPADEDDKRAAIAAVTNKFLEKSQADWCTIFEDVDACVYPVVEWQQVLQHEHNAKRSSFDVLQDVPIPKPAPRLSRTPGQLNKRFCTPIEATEDALNVLRELNMGKKELQRLLDDQVVLIATEAKL